MNLGLGECFIKLTQAPSRGRTLLVLSSPEPGGAKGLGNMLLRTLNAVNDELELEDQIIFDLPRPMRD